jgi:hypothetical protein
MLAVTRIAHGNSPAAAAATPVTITAAMTGSPCHLGEFVTPDSTTATNRLAIAGTGPAANGDPFDGEGTWRTTTSAIPTRMTTRRT